MACVLVASGISLCAGTGGHHQIARTVQEMTCVGGSLVCTIARLCCETASHRIFGTIETHLCCETACSIARLYAAICHLVGRNPFFCVCDKKRNSMGVAISAFWAILQLENSWLGIRK
jgi:hypothetical protein